MMSHAGTVQLEPKVEHDVINPSQNSNLLSKTLLRIQAWTRKRFPLPLTHT